MIKLIDILENKILVPRRSKEERGKNHNIALQKKVQQYIKDGGKSDLELSGTPITSLPPGLSVGENLYLDNCKNLTSLPPDLSVGGSLYLNGTKITSLPSGLSVGIDLVANSKITSLPSDLKVGDGLYLSYTPLARSHTKEQIKQMVPDVKGDIYI